MLRIEDVFIISVLVFKEILNNDFLEYRVLERIYIL